MTFFEEDGPHSGARRNRPRPPQTSVRRGRGDVEVSGNNMVGSQVSVNGGQYVEDDDGFPAPRGASADFPVDPHFGSYASSGYSAYDDVAPRGKRFETTAHLCVFISWVATLVTIVVGVLMRLYLLGDGEAGISRVTTGFSLFTDSKIAMLSCLALVAAYVVHGFSRAKRLHETYGQKRFWLVFAGAVLIPVTSVLLFVQIVTQA